uniref:F-box domain-containing protein n=1 Tax=Panagrellus redivivus TaxID=6233 RepID=A0A7E4VIL6_PANRE
MIPLLKLPYAFKERLIRLASLKTVSKLATICPDVTNFRYNQMFITDNEEVFRWASTNTFLFQVFKLLYQFRSFKYILDGHFSFNSTWKSVLRVSDIQNNNRCIHVNDILILNCQNYQNVIPFIVGPYNKLIIHGRITWEEVKKLIHDGVKEVRINARMSLAQEQYDDVVDFLMKHLRGVDHR